MNNRHVLLLLSALLSWPLAQAFEDKPALTTAERLYRKASKATGLAVGAVASTATGLGGGAVYGYATKDIRTAAGVVGGGVVAAPAAGFVGYKTGGFIALRVLAKYHGVSSRVEMVSQYYDINLLQYGALLLAAEKKANIEHLNKAVNDVYVQRFGADWKERLTFLFDTYKDGANLFSARSAYPPKDEKDFIRMMELGAAMSNLYFKTKPNIKNIVKDATAVYQKLGLL